MRFAVDIDLKGEKEVLIPADYARNINLLLKEALDDGDVNKECFTGYEKYYEDTDDPKPFTFALLMPVSKVKSNEKTVCFVVDSDILKFFFASNDYRFLIKLYNGLLNIDPDFSPFDFPVELKNFHIKKNSPIKTNKIKVETLSPVIIKNCEKEYINFNDPDIKKYMFMNIEDTCKIFISPDFKIKERDFDINFINQHITKIYKNKATLPATICICEIKAPVEVLKVIYNVGLGELRSQGFGMLEIYG